MINIAMRSQGTIDRDSLSSINTLTQDVVQAQTLHSLNTGKERQASQTENIVPVRQAALSQTASHQQQIVQSQAGSGQLQAAQSQAGSGQLQAAQSQTGSGQQSEPSQAGSGQQSELSQAGSGQSQTAAAAARKPIPPLQKMMQKGQKVALTSQTPPRVIKACLGWNTTNAQCDVDVSAFLLDGTGKVPGDDWFVFYGQTESPDHSTVFCPENTVDRESITVHLDKLNPSVKKIVFVLTIHEALEKNLHFGMVQDAYIRILNDDSQEELVSFQMDEYYTNVISMMIGEVYLHNGIWKFNAVGNGVAKDLSGLCGLYGVQVEN